MKGINHLVLAGNDLDAMRSVYAALGFTLTPRAQHPFGTGNSVIQLHGSYLELLALTKPEDVPEDRAGYFSFAGFNRDYLRRHEGFSMLVLDTADAAADIAAWRAGGLQTYAPFEFSRMAAMPDGDTIRLGFSLAYISDPRAPWLGHFACQHFAPEYYAQPRYLSHANGATHVHDVWITGDGALALATHMSLFTGVSTRSAGPGRTEFKTAAGTVILAKAGEFERAFGMPPPHPFDGPHLAGYTVGCRSLDVISDMGLEKMRERHVVPPAAGFGTAIGFIAAERP
ncbi:hypothetical protein BH10PSE7_BH10PSE7_11010 [soil metagenome]